MSLPRRVVLTGIGLVTPVGVGTVPFWQALRQGQSGIRRIRAFDSSPLPSQIGGEVEGFDARQFVDKKDRKRLNQMARAFLFAVGAAQLALEDARIDRNTLEPERFGVFMGSSSLPGELAELGPAARACLEPQADRIDLQKWGELGLDLIPPMWLLNHIPNIVSCHISILFNAQGPSNTITQSDAGGLLALGEAFRTIQRGKADVLLVGGSDTKVVPVNMARYPLFFEVSRRNDCPETACRPFDRDRDGMVLSEGAGILVLEELEHAQRRGARIYAEVAGFAAAFDRQRDGWGLARAVHSSLHVSGLSVDDLDHINAQGYSTRREDVWEARGLHEVLRTGTRTVPVLAVKSYVGNLGAAAGPVEMAASLLALQDGTLPATRNHEHPDPECPVTVSREPRPVERQAALKVGFTEMGQCAAVVIRRREEKSS